jgi:Tfp pilus assembly protein PilV
MKPHERGMALIEALVASALLGVGMVGATQLAIQGLHTATDTRQRLTAHSLALEAMDCLQSLKAACPMDDSITLHGSTYSRQSQLSPRSGLAMMDIIVTVQWTGAARASQTHSGNTGSHSKLVLRGSRTSVPIWVGVSSP